MEYEFHENAEREGKDGDKFVIARVLVGTCNSMAAEDIDLMNYVIRNLLFRPLMSHKGTFTDRDEFIGDACYHLSKDAIGFLRGNVVVEINIHPFKRQDGRVGGQGQPDDALRAKIVEAARRVDALLMEKMFTDEVRIQIHTAEHKRTEDRRDKSRDTDKTRRR